MGVVAVQRQALAVNRIAACVTIAEFPDGVPAADVGPADIGGNNGGFAGALHDRVIDGYFRRSGEGFRIEREEAEIMAGLCDGLAGGVHHVGGEGLEFADHRIRAEKEISGVPEVAGADIALGDVARRLLHKSLYTARRSPRQRGARLDVAVAGGGLGRLNAEGDDEPLRRRLGRLAASRQKFRLLGDDMIRGEQRHDRFGVALGRERSGDGDGRAGIAAGGFGDDRGVDSDLCELLLHEKAIVVIGHDDGGGEGVAHDSQHRILKCRARADQGDELFRHGFARLGPHTSPRAAAHDHRLNLTGHMFLMNSCRLRLKIPAAR